MFLVNDAPSFCRFDFDRGERRIQNPPFGFIWVEINSARQMVFTHGTIWEAIPGSC